MRVADRSTARNFLKYLSKARTDYAETNHRIASGHRFEELSDDVSAGTRVLRARTDLYKSKKQYDNVKTISEEMKATEDGMTSINDILNDIHGKKIIKALDDTTGEAGRKAIANEIHAMRQEILQFANTQYGKKYVFGASNASNRAPFTLDGNGNVLYNGINVNEIQKRNDGTYFYVSNGKERDIPMNDDIYMDIGLGIKMNGSKVDPATGFKISYSGLEIMGFGQTADGKSNNIINVLKDIEDAIRNNDKEALGDLDTHLTELTDKFRSNLTDIGAKTNFLETMETRLKNSVDGYKTKINMLMGTNDGEESTNQTMNEYVLKAVIQMGARILPVSLMDFLR